MMSFTDRGRQFFTGEGKGVRIMLVGTLAAILLLAVWLVVKNLFGGQGPRTVQEVRQLEQAEGVHMQCVKCRHEWTVPVEEVERLSKDLRVDDVMVVGCPKCKAKGSGYRMTRCPACGTHYLPKQLLDKGGGDTMNMEYRCPLPRCGVRLVDWWKQHPPGR